MMSMHRISRLLVIALAVLTTAACATSSRKERFEEKLQERFTAADANGDGRLTPEEADGKMPFVYKHFKEIDTDGNGTVTLADIRAYFAAEYARRHE